MNHERDNYHWNFFLTHLFLYKCENIVKLGNVEIWLLYMTLISVSFSHGHPSHSVQRIIAASSVVIQYIVFPPLIRSSYYLVQVAQVLL